MRLSAVARASGFRDHEYWFATVVFACVLCLWFLPLLGGAQLGQNHVLYESTPWSSDRPADLDTPQGEELEDAAYEYYPVLAAARRQVHNGLLPLWNPYVYGGAPLLGDLQSGLAFPLTWLAFVFPLETAWGLIAVLKLLVAGLGAYALARTLGTSRNGALISGLVNMLCAPNIVWMQWSLGSVFVMLPWLLVATHRLALKVSAARVAVLGAVVGLSILAGHAESVAFSSLAAGVYLAVVLAARGAWAEWMRALSGFAAANVLGAALGAVVLLPFLAGYHESITREAHGMAAGADLPFASLLTWTLPDLFGNDRPDYYGPLFYLYTAAHVGVTTLLLTALALARRRPPAAALGLAAMAVLALMTAYGAPPVSWIVGSVPLLDEFNDVRIMYIPALAAAIGAGAGFDLLVRRPLTLRRWFVVTGAALAVVGAGLGLAKVAGDLPAPREIELEAVGRFAAALVLAAGCLGGVGRVRAPAAAAAVFVVCALELSYLRDFNALLPADKANPPEPPVVRALTAPEEPLRVTTMRRPGRDEAVLPGSTGALYGIEGIHGYDFPQSKRWADFSWFVLRYRGITREVNTSTGPPPRGPVLEALRMMNAGLLLAPPATPPPNSSFTVVYRGPDATVFRDPLAMPRAYVVPRVRPIADEGARALLARGAVDLRDTALVPPSAPKPLGAGGRLRAARAERLGPERLRVSVPAGPAGWLVVANGHTSQWRARVDGRPAKLWPTNLAATGLPLAAGPHTVELSYDRRPFWLGLGITLASLLAAIATLALANRSRGRGPSAGYRSPA